jgi:hypothetical protein
MTVIRHWDVYVCPGECIGRSGLWNVAAAPAYGTSRPKTCPKCGRTVEPVRVTNDTGAVAERDRLRAENERLREAIATHRTDIESAGSVFVLGFRGRRRARWKHQADHALWRALNPVVREDES